MLLGFRHWALLGLVGLLALGLGLGAGITHAAPPVPAGLPAAIVPAAVHDGTARLVGTHPGADRLHLLFLLPLRDRAGLDAFLADVSNPRSPNFGQYLTLAEANARFNPDPAHEARVLAWLRAAGIPTLATTRNHLYVEATSTVASFRTLLGVAINDYQWADRTFYAPDRVPVLPAAVQGAVAGIVGLSTDVVLHKVEVAGNSIQNSSDGTAQGQPPYYPQDLANAYNVNPLWDAGFTGQGSSIGITLWGAAPSDTTLNAWAATTGAAVATRANGRLVIVPENGGSTVPDDGAAGQAIEAAGGMAPAATIRFYEAATDTSGNPDLSALIAAVNDAGIDPANNRLISNPWYGPESYGLIVNFDSVLASNAATGHTYLFPSGDNGSWGYRDNQGDHDPYPTYPASSSYVVAVGGTRFAANIGATWPGEAAWTYARTAPPTGSGGGYSLLFTRPTWQTAPGVNNARRGYPDVAAVADPATSFFTCYGNNSACTTMGTTSLGSALWAGMLTLANQYAMAQGRPALGFVAPTLYTLAGNTPAFPPYQDVTSGTNGAYQAGAGWDAVTGLGSPNLWNLARDLGGAPATATPTATATATASPSPSPTFQAGQRFTDVPPGALFYDQINWCFDQGIISGYANGDGTYSFRPANNATRAQVSKMLVLAAGWPTDTSGGPHFRDVPEAQPFYNVVETAYQHGVISGYTCGASCLEFRPNATVTRGQFAKMIVQAKGWPADTTDGPHFRDVPIEATFYGPIETAYHHNIISGYSCGIACLEFRPATSITRGQLAKLIYGAYSQQERGR